MKNLIFGGMTEEVRGHGRSRNCSRVKTDVRLDFNTFMSDTKHSNLSHNTNSSDVPVRHKTGSGNSETYHICYLSISMLAC